MNKTPLIIITGASSGIGNAVAKLFSEAGYATALLARNKNAMDALQLKNSISIECDVTNIQSVEQAINIAQEKFGPVDCLINNAGVAKGGEFTEVSHNDNQKMIDVNLTGVINCIETVLPSMQKNKSGTIINMSSLSDRKSRPTLPVYAATKAAVKSLSESLRTSNAKYGIRICNIAPAKIKTPMTIVTNLLDDQLVQVDDMAKVILWVYQQPQTVCIRDIVIAPTYYEA
jgi:NADP-dependent 3-hydroxy acid dehydrogenase YdfG